MESIYYQRLLDRDLWIDGDSSLHVDAICKKILEGDIDFLKKESISESAKPEVKKFIELIDETISDKISVKTRGNLAALDSTFMIPETYYNMDIEKRVVEGLKFRHELEKIDSHEIDSRLTRIAEELNLYSEKGLVDVLKCSAFIIDRLKSEGMVWGPGRGSACCSYVLYLLEVHDIDSFYFGLGIDEFLR